MNSRTLARHIAQAAYDKKAQNIITLNLTKLSSFADYFIIASGRSDRQVQAIAHNIEGSLKKEGGNPIGVEGYGQGRWVLIDFGSVVAHVFYEEERKFYNLERLWSDAKRIRFKLK